MRKKVKKIYGRWNKKKIWTLVGFVPLKFKLISILFIVKTFRNVTRTKVVEMKKKREMKILKISKFNLFFLEMTLRELSNLFDGFVLGANVEGRFQEPVGLGVNESYFEWAPIIAI